MLYVPVTFVWVDKIRSGVPLGTHVAWLSKSTTGKLSDLTLTATVVHCAVTHGTGEPDTLNGHPVILYGAAMVTIGCSLILTRALNTVGCACPPCTHCTVASFVSKNPGIVFLSYN